MDEANNEKIPKASAFYPSSHYGSFKARWQENHGNVLLCFLGLILLVGAAILGYRQSRFVPPRFPESDMIQTPTISESVAAEDVEGAVMIEVTGATVDSGVMRLAIYETVDQFAGATEPYQTEVLSVQEGTARFITLPEMLPERFVIAAYHDENDDGQLNRNTFGVPSERYGFSRNARGLTGPPEFSEALIERPEAGHRLQIIVR